MPGILPYRLSVRQGHELRALEPPPHHPADTGFLLLCSAGPAVTSLLNICVCTLVAILFLDWMFLALWKEQHQPALLPRAQLQCLLHCLGPSMATSSGSLYYLVFVLLPKRVPVLESE